MLQTNQHITTFGVLYVCTSNYGENRVEQGIGASRPLYLQHQLQEILV